jgi:serine/threonine protein kinase
MRIGSYQVLFELARGGMGTVYLARAMGPGGVERLVAIKRAHPHLLAEKGVADRFLDEARVAAHVHHANVVGVHQAGSDEDGYYLVFDYVEGESLGGLVERAFEQGKRVPPRIVIRVVMDALAGLHAAHETTHGSGKPLGILHRDVSVQNVLVGRDGVTRLTDFGIAKSALSSVVTEQSYLQGKLVYLAPEYLQRRPVDRTLDVYAAGVTLWIALAGHLPWPAADEAQMLNSILLDGVPDLSSVGVEIAPEIEAIVSRACHLDPRERFQTARQMLEALEAAGASNGSVASHTEVAGYVEAAAGPELAARRETIDKMRNSFVPTHEDDASVPAVTEASSLDGTRAPVSTAFHTSTPGESRTWEKPWPVRGLLYAGAALLLVVAAVVLLRARRVEHAGKAIDDAPSASAASGTTASPEPAPLEPLRGNAPRGTPAPEVPLPSSAPPSASPTAPVPGGAVSKKPHAPKDGHLRAPAPKASQGFESFSTSNPYR